MSGLNKSMDLRSIKTSNDVLANKGLIICPYKFGRDNKFCLLIRQVLLIAIKTDMFERPLKLVGRKQFTREHPDTGNSGLSEAVFEMLFWA